MQLDFLWCLYTVECNEDWSGEAHSLQSLQKVQVLLSPFGYVGGVDRPGKVIRDIDTLDLGVCNSTTTVDNETGVSSAGSSEVRCHLFCFFSAQREIVAFTSLSLSRHLLCL